ncbi:MAG TPA: carboxypeptidase-like regulatory domain-containing protein, partial [Bryobacteraceae bacterium]|nr:carboxypeptidase-like regulatory domain-containing protein [Bryobacteraceae bacterium]
MIAGAEVRLTDPATRNTLSTTTNDAGRYSFVNVPPAVYDVTISKQGFTVRKVNAQEVRVGQLLTINGILEVGSTSTTVEVSAAAGADLQTSNASIGTTLSGNSLLMLPNMSRDASALAIYQPGVSPEGSVAGAIYDQNTFQLDGGNNSNDMDGSMNVYTPSYASNGAPTGTMPTPIESIEEFKVN